MSATFQETRDNFLKVLNGNVAGRRGPLSTDDVDRLIKMLSRYTDNTNDFLPYIYKLKTLDLSKRTYASLKAIIDESLSTDKVEGINVLEDNGVRKTNSAAFLFAGGNGITFRSESQDRCYKYIQFKPDTVPNDVARELFLESWIQSVLNLDSKYGNNTAKITGIYRSTQTTPRSGIIEVFITMNYIPYSFTKFTKKLYTDNGHRVTPEEIIPQFTMLTDILMHFNKTYNFFHRDLHTGNVMFNADLDPVLIDFGMSCFAFELSSDNSTPYFFKKDAETLPQQNILTHLTNPPPEMSADGECFSYDLLLLFTRIYENSHKYLDKATLDFIYLCMCSKDGRIKLWDIMVKNKTRLRANAIWHIPYYWQLGDLSRYDPLLVAVRNVQTITPKVFNVACRDYDRFIASRPWAQQDGAITPAPQTETYAGNSPSLPRGQRTYNDEDDYIDNVEGPGVGEGRQPFWGYGLRDYLSAKVPLIGKPAAALGNLFAGRVRGGKKSQKRSKSNKRRMTRKH